MTLSTGHIAGQLEHLIWYNLDNNLIRNALFLAHRLSAFEPNSYESQYYLANCHLLNGEVKTAYEVIRDTGLQGVHAGCSYVFAQACLDMGNYVEGLEALECSKSIWVSRVQWNAHNKLNRQPSPDASAAFLLQAKLYDAHKESQKAVDCYVDSLRLNPFNWDALKGLCATGTAIRVDNIYQLTPELRATINANLAGMAKMETSDEFFNPDRAPDPMPDPFMGNDIFGGSGLFDKHSAKAAAAARAPEGMETPGTQGSVSEEFPIANGVTDPMWDPPMAPARKKRDPSSRKLNVETRVQPPPRMRSRHQPTVRNRSDSSADDEPLRTTRVGDRKRTVTGQVAHPSSPPVEPIPPQRRSRRLFNQSHPTSVSFMSMLNGGPREPRATALGRPTNASISTVGRIVSGNQTPVEAPISESTASRFRPGPMPRASEKKCEIDALKWLLGEFKKLASGYYELSRYNCSDAIKHFKSLDSAQYDTPWVFAQIGRAYFEQAMYADAAIYFNHVRELSPYHLEDMEIYSTVLWHLKDDNKLTHLARELMDVDRFSPQAWCAVGNSFSHQRNQEQSVKCFKRATQLDPDFAYGFTLQGHEYLANEEFDNALDAYRNALKADVRHYNAWYGLGQVYEKLGKLEEAEQHFRHASFINPSNSVLICCIGHIQERCGELMNALGYYKRACVVAPMSILARFRKARILEMVHDYEGALHELIKLKDLAPDEPNVHFSLGKHNAVICSCWGIGRSNSIGRKRWRPKTISTCEELIKLLQPARFPTLPAGWSQVLSSTNTEVIGKTNTQPYLGQSSNQPLSLNSCSIIPATMSWASCLMSGISSLVLVTGSLFAIGTKFPRAAFAARCIAAYGCLLFSAAYGVFASIVLRLVGFGRISQWATARCFKWVMLLTTGVKFEIIEGQEYLTTRPAVFLANHQTELDVLMLGAVFPPYCSVTAKKSLRNVPFLGWFMTLSRTVFIDRANRETAVKAFDSAVEEMHVHRQSVFIFPEGTRSYSDKPTLLPFKKGAFHLAVKAGVPIVPIIAENYAHILYPKAWRFNAGTIKIRVLPPIETKQLTAADVDSLTTSTRDAMLRTIMEMAGVEESSESVSTAVEL
ncbi:20S cyclosome subunit (BimA/Nuc2/Cdc27) [Penicillium taxi]|uniref:20S cyclosome subunit (BimA/Nuc2/Cdc27) n=1 Tax=Penicillium taxi TaxID=168475 RepID=UPI0025453B81|nr:20S cyclosome subunit (BimA/Nuc2/Cdc27) [Penicillium taxi]KAJ5888703.1 20S cyclosome subunit (BimA/Nuc2/Cdc27) [Penicillium taxi]